MRDNQLTLRDTSGAALSVWAHRGTSGDPSGTESDREHPSHGRPDRGPSIVAPAGVRIKAHGNRFTFGQALLSFTGYSDRGAWQGGIAWDGDNNVYDGPATRVFD